MEDFRPGHSTALERAEVLLDRAIATFQERTGEHEEAAWPGAAIVAARRGTPREPPFPAPKPVGGVATGGGMAGTVY